MIKTILIDDEPLARALVLEYLSQYPEIVVVAECADGFEGVKKINELKPDLIFLDIQMPKITGFEMLELLDEMPSVIFTTAFDEYAIKAFDNNAIDYLLKPFSPERFAKAINKWKASKQLPVEINQKIDDILNNKDNSLGKKNRIVLKDKGKIKIIPMETVNYIEASSDFVKIFAEEGMFLKSKTMNYFESTLDANMFVRVHRSFFININKLTRLELYEKESYIAILSNGSKIPISKTGHGKLKLILGI